MSKFFSLLKGISKKAQLGLVLLALVFSTVFVVSDTTQVEAQGASGGAVMSSCALENIGWIACPVIRAAARASDFAFTFISQSFMQIEVSLLQGDVGTSRAWGIARNIANTLFVLFLLYVIYGILTGRGASNASIKRMLPRFIVAAILVNFSFVLGQVAVDISNIVGSSIQSVMTSVAGDDNIIAAPDGTLGGQVGADGYAANDGAIARVTSAILSNPNLAWVLLVPLISVVMSVSVITSVMIIILIIRKVLIVALLLLAPIAFVLYLLPNTEQYFSRWFRMFTQLLLLFPVMAVLLGAGQIVGSAVMSTTGDSYTVSGDNYQTATGGTASATTSLVAIGATVLPLLGTWYAFRGAMQAMDTSVARLQGAGARGLGGDPSKDAERMKRASQSMQRNSLLSRGADSKLKRVTDIQNENSSSVVGVAGNSVIRRRKKAVKSPEQQQFDQQVQNRLSELKQGVESGEITATPQQLYVKALQNLDTSGDGSGSSGQLGSVGLGSFENVELKAAEAYLLESIGRNPESNSIDPKTFLQQQANQQTNNQQNSQQNNQEDKLESNQRNMSNQQSIEQLTNNQENTQQQILMAQQGQNNIPQPNQAIAVPGRDQNEQRRMKSDQDKQPVSKQEDGRIANAGGVQPNLNESRSDDQLGRPLSDREQMQKQAIMGGGGRGVERTPDGAASVVFPAAINERIPTRLKPVTDLEKKAQALAAKHVAASQEKANGASSFEEELRLRAEKSSLDPLRMLDNRQPGKDRDKDKDNKVE